MTSDNTDCLQQNCTSVEVTEVGSRFPDWHNLPKPRWGDVWRALAGPAARIHRYRNLRSATFYEAECEHHCRYRR